jgi:hypothetical protein
MVMALENSTEAEHRLSFAKVCLDPEEGVTAYLMASVSLMIIIDSRNGSAIETRRARVWRTK